MHLIARHFFFTIALLSLNAQAQEQRWYQVELLIFSQPGGQGSEQWDALPVLEYPGTSRFLVHPKEIAARKAEHQGPSELDDLGRLWLRLDQQTSEGDIPVAREPASGDGTAAPEPAVPTPAARLTPTPFIALPGRDSEFYGKAAYMQRAGGYRTLFHERWVQPVASEGNAIPIVIDRSGDRGDWPLLQGSVKIHISRFLHLETNLWLNTHGDYFPDNAWRMPAPPLGPPAVIVEEADPEPEEETYFISEPAAAELADPNEPLLSAEESGPVYPWRHAVALQQKRRMRSNEIHYLDHPLLGVVVLFTPLDEEQLKTMAEAEMANNPDSN